MPINSPLPASPHAGCLSILSSSGLPFQKFFFISRKLFMFPSLPGEGSRARWRAGRRALPQPLLEIQRQIVHCTALNWLHSGISGPVLADTTEKSSSIAAENIAREEIPVQGGRGKVGHNLCRVTPTKASPPLLLLHWSQLFAFLGLSPPPRASDEAPSRHHH